MRLAFVVLLLHVSTSAIAQDDGADPAGKEAGVQALLKDSEDATKDDGGAGPVTRTGSLSASAAGLERGASMRITHAGGPVSVRCGAGKGVSVRGKYVVTGSQAAALDQYVKQLQVHAEARGDSGTVASTVPAKPSGIASVEVALEVTLPETARLDVDAQVPIRVTDCAGALNIPQGDGAVHAAGAFSSVDVKTRRGDLRVDLTDASALTGESTLQAPDGAIDVRLPAGYSGRLKAKAKRVAVELPVEGTVTPTLVDGRIGAGKAAVTATAERAVDVRTR